MHLVQQWIVGTHAKTHTIRHEFQLFSCIFVTSVILRYLVLIFVKIYSILIPCCSLLLCFFRFWSVSFFFLIRNLELNFKASIFTVALMDFMWHLLKHFNMRCFRRLNLNSRNVKPCFLPSSTQRKNSFNCYVMYLFDLCFIISGHFWAEEY